MQKPPPTPARSLFRDPVIWAVVVVNAAVALLALFPILDANTTYLLIESYALVPISILGMLAPWVGLPPMRSGREKVFWGLWSLSLFFHLVVRITYLVIPDIDAVASGSLVSDLLYVLFYLPLVLSVLFRPDRARLEAEVKGTTVLEYAGTAIYILALITYFVIIPRFFNEPEYATWVPSLLMYWVLDAFILLSLFYLRQTSQSREWKILYSWLIIAPSCWVITEMLELTFYMGWDGTTDWAVTPFDVLWYIPWIAITVAGRVRAAPVPHFLGAGHQDLDPDEAIDSLGRPGWLQIAALVLPFVHILSNLLGLLDPSTRNLRELVVLISLVLLLGMASLHQKILGAKTLALARRSRELEERKRLLAAAVEQFPDAVLIADGGGVVRYGNRASSELEDGSKNVLGAPLLKAFPRGLEGASEGVLEEAVMDSLAVGKAWEGRTVSESSEGSREELVTLSPVRNEAGVVVHWVLIRRDVTYLNQLERQFRQAQRMETVGTLAGGIARDFNDLLGEIYGYGESLKGELDPASPAFLELLGILSAAERTAELVNQVQAFGREGEDERTPVAMDSLMREAIALLRPTVPPFVRISEKIEEGACTVLGVRHQLRQVILNLGRNAAQAMDPDGGKLAFELGQLWVDAAEAVALELQGPGDFYLISVRDTGRGMDEQTLARVFDPFFTTKDMGKGTGLGLYLVRETVAGHGGAVRVKSEPGWGTLFQIYLPCSLSGADRPPDTMARYP